MSIPSRGPDRPRVLLVSIRRLNTHAAWCANYAFEDIIRAVDDVDLLELEPGPGFEVRQHLSRSVAWRGFRTLNPGVKPVKLERDYDVLLFACINAWDLLYLNAVADWETRCKIKLCFMAEIYAEQIGELGNLLRRLQDFDHVFQCFEASVEPLARAIGKSCQHLALGADVLQFSPYPKSRPRVIDVLSIGRRSEPVHQALRRLAASRDIFYVYDTLPSSLIRPSDPVEHREMFAASARASRFFVTSPSKFGDMESRGQSETGARYFEGAAAGAVLLGQAPASTAFRRDFPWSDAVVEVKPDGSDVVDIVRDSLGRPEELACMGRRNALAALRGYDWAYRWQSMLATADVAPRPGLAERLRALEMLAVAVERSDTAATAAAPTIASLA